MPSSLSAIREAQAELGLPPEDDILGSKDTPMESQSIHAYSDHPTPCYKRVLLKVSGESLGNVYTLDTGEVITFGLNDDRLEQVAREIVEAKNMLKVDFAIVTGGGNWWRGRSNNRMDSNQSDYIGMLGTVQNGIALEDALKQLGAEVRLNTTLGIRAVGEPFYPKPVKSDLDKGYIVICSGGLGEPGFTTDTTAAQRARGLDIPVVLYAKEGVNGIYTSDPKTDPNAKRIDELEHLDIVKRKLKVMDATAAAHAGEHGVDLVVYDGREPGILIKVLCEPEKYGTMVRTAA